MFFGACFFIPSGWIQTPADGPSCIHYALSIPFYLPFSLLLPFHFWKVQSSTETGENRGWGGAGWSRVKVQRKDTEENRELVRTALA